MGSGTVLFGLLIATLADRVRYEVVAKAIIFLPMAISFVGAGVIWKFVYDYETSGAQIGLLNAFITELGLARLLADRAAGEHPGINCGRHLDVDRLLHDHPLRCPQERADRNS